jgi:hypothetical protein
MPILVLVLILFLLQARAMEKKRNQAREEALAILEQLEQAEADEEGIDGDTAAYEERETENEGAGPSGRLAFGDLAVASRAQNTKQSKSKRTDDDYSDLDLENDDEDDDDDEDDEGGKKRKFQMHQVKKDSSKKKSKKVYILYFRSIDIISSLVFVNIP